MVNMVFPYGSNHITLQAVWYWLTCLCDKWIAEQALSIEINPNGVILYTGDRWLLVRDGMLLQEGFSDLVGYFEQLGLKDNEVQINAMI